MKFSNVSAYSFGSSKRNYDKSIATPGPGYYTTEYKSLKTKAPGWKIGTSKRENSFYSEIPGPGQYASTSKLGKSPKYSFGLKNQIKEGLGGIDTPGPGNYNPEYKKIYKNVSYSILGKKELSKVEHVPGPGQYNVSDKLNNSACKFGKEKKGYKISENSNFKPGPGQYIQSERVIITTPKYSFGKDSKIKESRPWTPGPGQYTSLSKMGKEGPKYSVGKSSRPYSTTKSSNTLGPGAYTTNFYNKPKGPNAVIGKSKKDQSYIDDLPGPGMYVPSIGMKVKKEPSYSMGKSERIGNKTKYEDLMPGPGNYHTNGTIGKGPKYTIGGKHDKEKLNFVPGPGSYKSDVDYNVIRQKNPSWKIGTSKREITSENLVPGPGMYSSKQSRPSSAYRFGNEKRDVNKCENTPGPGQYKIPCSIAEVANYSNGSFKQLLIK